MPLREERYYLESGTLQPDTTPAYNITQRTWNDTSQAVRRRLNMKGDKDGSPNGVALTCNISSGLTGTILMGQFVLAQSFSPRRFIGTSGSAYMRGTIAGLVSVSTVNARLTSGVCFISNSGVIRRIGTTSWTSTYGVNMSTTLTSQFFMDVNAGQTFTLNEAGSLVLELGVSVTASTTAGTATIYIGSNNTTDLNENLAGATTALNPYIRIDPDMKNQDIENYRRMRAEGSEVSANMGW